MKHVVGQVVAQLLATDAHVATKFVSPTHVVRATRVLCRGRVPKSVDIRLTIGRPNYNARKAIKTLVKADEPFPVRKVQLKFPPKRKR